MPVLLIIKGDLESDGIARLHLSDASDNDPKSPLFLISPSDLVIVNLSLRMGIQDYPT